MKCINCGQPYVSGRELPKGASVVVLPNTRVVRPQPGEFEKQLLRAVSARWIRPLKIWALQDQQSRFVRPPCLNPNEIIAFRGPNARAAALRAALAWNTP